MLKIWDTVEPQGEYPAVKAEHVEMPDGSRLNSWKPPGITTCDLVAMGLPAVPMTGDAVAANGDTTEIISAISAGPVAFTANVDMGGQVIPVSIIMSGLVSATGCTCTYTFDLMGAAYTITVIVNAGMVMVYIRPLTAYMEENLGEIGEVLDAINGGNVPGIPHRLTFTGAVNATYDGSEAVSVEIPTDDHINNLIKDALGVIENGTY